MRINADFNQRVLIHSEDLDWIESPMQGVTRRPLDRIGGEVARATTIVRYEPGSRFSPHVHTGGEEFIVLEGVFQDEHGDFPAGSYIRNPPQSSHTPASETGCVIFVKLWQFNPEDRTHIRLNLQFMEPVYAATSPMVSIIPLYKDENEEVAVYVFDPGAELDLSAEHGAELLILKGGILESGDQLVRNSWLRVPQQSKIQAKASSEGAKVWIKRNHLKNVQAEIGRVKAAGA